jgi:riboflavin synthase
VFTGLVEGLGRVERVIGEDAGLRLTIRWPGLSSGDPLKLGESVALSGCCLTVVDTAGDSFDVQAGPETLARTNLGDRRPGDGVNLERALRASDRLGGHFVQGHVDTTATLRERRRDGEWEFIAFHIDPRWTDLMVPKGSIAVDGVSLTLLDVWPDAFSVMLIPHTLAVTSLGGTRPGDRVNIEVDILAKHVRKLLGGNLIPGSAVDN